MSKNLSKKVASLADRKESQTVSYADFKHLSLDDLSNITREMLMDKDLEVSKVRPFFWTLVETYVDRFQILPFDAIKALFSYLELQDYPQEQMHDLVGKLEKLYKKQHGAPMRQTMPEPAARETGALSLDDEIDELRDTLKYAAIVGERLDDEK